MGDDPKLQLQESGSDFPGEGDHESAWRCMPCRDVLFAALFIATMVSVFVFLGMYQSDHQYIEMEQGGDSLGTYMGIACGLAFAWVLVWIIMMWACASCMIKIGILFCILLQAAAAAWCFSREYYLGGGLFAGLTLMTMIWACMMRNQLALAGKMVEIASRVLFLNPCIF